MSYLEQLRLICFSLNLNWKLSLRIDFPKFVKEADINFIFECLRDQPHIVRYIASKIRIVAY